NGRLLIFDPGQLCRSKIPRRIQQMLQTPLLAYSSKSLVPVWHGTAVTPNDAAPQDTPFLVNHHKSMHLIGNSDRSYVSRVISTHRMRLTDSLLHILPPCFRTLLRPTRLF